MEGQKFRKIAESLFLVSVHRSMRNKKTESRTALTRVTVRNRFWIGYLLRQSGYTEISDLDLDYWLLKYPLQGDFASLLGLPISNKKKQKVKNENGGKKKKREKKLTPKDGSSKMLHKYWRGEVPVSSKAIGRFEAIYPGSRYQADNAMWAILFEDKPTPETIDSFLRSLPQTLKAHLFRYDRTLGREVRNASLTFEAIASISREGHYDAMGCLLGLLWECRLLGKSQLLVNYCAEEIANLLKRLVASIPFLDLTVALLGILHGHPCMKGISSRQAWLTEFDLASAQTTTANLIRLARTLKILGTDPDEMADFLFWSYRDSGAVVMDALNERLTHRHRSPSIRSRREALNTLHRLEVYRQQPKIGFQNMLLVGHLL